MWQRAGPERDQSGTRAGPSGHPRRDGLCTKSMSIVNEQAAATTPYNAPADIVEALLWGQSEPIATLSP